MNVFDRLAEAGFPESARYVSRSDSSQASSAIRISGRAQGKLLDVTQDRTQVERPIPLAAESRFSRYRRLPSMRTSSGLKLRWIRHG